MSHIFRLICGRCTEPEFFPKSSISTNYSARNELKLPLSRMEPLKRFNIVSAENEIIILHKSIYRIFAYIKHTFYNKKGGEKKSKSVCKSIKKSKLSIILSKSSNTSPPKLQNKKNEDIDLILGLDIKLLNNYEEGFFSNDKVMKEYVQNFPYTNFTIFYTSSFSSKILKNLILEKSDYGIEIGWVKGLEIINNFNKKEYVFSEAIKPQKIFCDSVFIDLLDYNGFTFNNSEKILCLKSAKIKELIVFISSILEKSKKCVILLPPETYLEDFVEIFDEVLINEDLQKKFSTYTLQFEGVYYENELEFIQLTFDECEIFPRKKQIEYLMNIFLKTIPESHEKNEFSQNFEEIISRIGLRKSLHYIYQDENSEKAFESNFLLIRFMKKLINENLIDYDEALKFNNYLIFNQIDLFENDFNLTKSLQKLKEEQKINKIHRESVAFPKIFVKTNLKNLNAGKEDLTPLKNNNSQKNINFPCEVNEKELSFEISEKFSQFSFSDYSFQKSSQKNIEEEDLLSSILKNNDGE